MEFAVRIVHAGQEGQDRAAVLPFRGGHFIVLADGAGGVAGGAEAADAVVEFARGLDPAVETDWAATLSRLDDLLAARAHVGETTAILAFASNNRVVGASVGDSEAWSLVGGERFELTARQHRKPLLGSGRAVPVGFGPLPVGDRLWVGSDGLFKYVPPNLIFQHAMLTPPNAVRALVSAARLPNGSLQDDIAIIVAG